MPYISNTDKERSEMLAKIGVNNFEDLLTNIPQNFRLQTPLALEEALSELEIARKLDEIGGRNFAACRSNAFLGGGVYDHYIPLAVDHIIMRPEFLTAYTPYQAEVSQGTLQYIYEYQTMICELTGMDIANAGMYDGASAAAEAILMAVRQTKRQKAIVVGSINPLYLDVIKCYTEGAGVEILSAPTTNGTADLSGLDNLMSEDIACVLVQTPNFFGCLEEVFEIEKIVHRIPKTLYIVACDPISLAVCNAPCEYNADIVVGEGQTLGNKLNFGGPLFGFFATKMALARTMPGRIVGGTLDTEGKRAYALTLQAREQHIRREKATSNICSNQSLATLAATVYMSLLGQKGLQEVATQSTTKAHYLANELVKLPGISLTYDKPFFKEFSLTLASCAGCTLKKLEEKGIFGGINLKRFGYENIILVAVTEKKTKADLDAYIKAMAEVLND